MNVHKKLPRVALVGRVNVGKSTLFNRLSSQVKALTHDSEGVTRDPLYDTCSWRGYDFLIVDTGGAHYSCSDVLQRRAFEKSTKEIKLADILILVIDSRVGLSSDDYTLIEDLRKNGVPLIAALNKSEVIEASDTFHEVQGLGFDSVVQVSAAHGRGIEDLLESMIVLHEKSSHGKKEILIEEPAFKVALLGRPNVGKSSIMNILLKQERLIVSDIPGTTREAVTDQINFFQTTIQVSDTAGVRRPRSIHERLEELMVSSTMSALKDAHIILLVLDVSEKVLFDQDVKLAFYAFQNLYKGVVVLWNKSDLIDEDESAGERVEKLTSEYDFLFSKVPSLHISCKTKKNVGKIVPLVNELWKRFSQKLPSEEIQQLFISRLDKTPLMHKKERLYLYRAYMVASTPPTMLLQVNEPIWFGDSQRTFFENILREKYDLLGVPIKWIIRKK